MRIIAGSLKGRRLKCFKDTLIRPTPDRARETLFNVIGDSIVGSSFLDLFSGTGAVGIEAISRGAKEVVFVDSNPVAARVISANFNICGLGFEGSPQCELKISLVQRDAGQAIRKLGKSKRLFDFIFMDPPYRKGLYQPILKLLKEYFLLNSNGWIVMEHCSKDLPELTDTDFKQFRLIKVGDTSFSLLTESK